MSTDEQLADSMAAKMVAYVAKYEIGDMDFEVILQATVEHPSTRPTYSEPPFRIMWRRENVRGVTFYTDDGRAVAWVKTALLLGYTVFWGTSWCNLRKGPSVHGDEEGGSE